MQDAITDDTIRHLTVEALQLYRGFDEVFPGHLIEAVMVHLPTDFDRQRVETIVNEMISAT